MLEEIDAAVDDLVRQEDMSAERAGQIGAAVAEVRGALAPFQTTTTVTTAPPPPPDDEPDDDGDDDEDDSDEGRHHGRGKGKKER